MPRSRYQKEIDKEKQWEKRVDKQRHRRLFRYALKDINKHNYTLRKTQTWSNWLWSFIL